MGIFMDLPGSNPENESIPVRQASNAQKYAQVNSRPNSQIQACSHFLLATPLEEPYTNVQKYHFGKILSHVAVGPTASHPPSSISGPSIAITPQTALQIKIPGHQTIVSNCYGTSIKYVMLF